MVNGKPRFIKPGLFIFIKHDFDIYIKEYINLDGLIKYSIFLMSKEMLIQSAVVIHKPTSVVFDYVKYCKNQDNFSVWNMADPQKKTHYEGQDGEVGFIYSWDSTNKNVGAGTQEILSIEDGHSVTYQIRFERPMKSVATAEFVLKEVNAHTTELSWNFASPTKFPMNLFNFIFKRILVKDMTKSLANLKAVLES